MGNAGFRFSQGRKYVEIEIFILLHQLHIDVQTVCENVIEVPMLSVCAWKSP